MRLSTAARLSMYRMFSHLLILHSPWRPVFGDSDGLLKQPLDFPVNVSFSHTVHVCSERQRSPCLQGVGVALHHMRRCLLLAVLYPSLLNPCVSTLWWFFIFSFPPGEGSRPAVNHRTAGGHDTLRGRLFWVLGGPEGLKWGVLRSACWEEGGYSRWQRVGVGDLRLSSHTEKPARCLSPHLYVLCSLTARHHQHTVGGSTHRQNYADDWFHVWLQEEHHCEAVVPLLWAPAGEHLHSGAEYPRRQPRQPEEEFGGRTSGLKHATHTHTHTKIGIW